MSEKKQADNNHFFVGLFKKPEKTKGWVLLQGYTIGQFVWDRRPCSIDDYIQHSIECYGFREVPRNCLSEKLYRLELNNILRIDWIRFAKNYTLLAQIWWNFDELKNVLPVLRQQIKTRQKRLQNEVNRTGGPHDARDQERFDRMTRRYGLLFEILANPTFAAPLRLDSYALPGIEKASDDQRKILCDLPSVLVELRHTVFKYRPSRRSINTPNKAKICELSRMVDAHREGKKDSWIRKYCRDLGLNYHTGRMGYYDLKRNLANQQGTSINTISSLVEETL